jgi:CBS domain-containing protein
MIVEDNGTICGIVTDRDIAVRAVANDEDPKRITVARICSKQLETLAPNATTDQAVDMMRQKAVRRIPVVDHGRPVGIISLGDLAVALDPKSALADISAAPPNN